MSMTIVCRLKSSPIFCWNFTLQCLNWSTFSVQAKQQDLKNARLADICIGTSAAPTYLPAHYFETKDAEGNTRSFDLIDGGVAANNPVSSYNLVFNLKLWKFGHSMQLFLSILN